jgi:hypothetical protein
MLKATRIICTTTLFSILLLLNGCATVGRSFHYENIPQLEIGKFQLQDCQSVFGDANKVSKEINKSGQIDVKQYLYASANLGTAKARVLVLEFLNGKLNAYNFVSSFDEDRTLVDTDKLSQVTLEKSKSSDVLKILGKPNGIGRCPSILQDYKDRCRESNVTEVWIWSSSRKVVTLAAGNKNQGSTNVFISFDTNGVVKAIDSQEK